MLNEIQAIVNDSFSLNLKFFFFLVVVLSNGINDAKFKLYPFLTLIREL